MLLYVFSYQVAGLLVCLLKHGQEVFAFFPACGVAVVGACFLTVVSHVGELFGETTEVRSWAVSRSEPLGGLGAFHSQAYIPSRRQSARYLKSKAR